MHPTPSYALESLIALDYHIFIAIPRVIPAGHGRLPEMGGNCSALHRVFRRGGTVPSNGACEDCYARMQRSTILYVYELVT